jgi:hypothetical protein
MKLTGEIGIGRAGDVVASIVGRYYYVPPVTLRNGDTLLQKRDAGTYEVVDENGKVLQTGRVIDRPGHQEEAGR